tara:strand:- start:1411 stop:2253 length:843 start_codon:yes stop_codon:yes gene_type:complete
MNIEEQYLDALRNVLSRGHVKSDRTGTGTKGLLGLSLSHNFSEGFPLLTTKKMFVKGILGELLWFLKGTEDPQFLVDNNIHIWDPWFKETPEGAKTLPHTYGVKWRNFDGVDQIQGVIDSISTNPYSRRHVVSAWDPRFLEECALPWCHVLFQFHCLLDKDIPPSKQKDDGCIGDLSITVYQRSADLFLGVPFNIASYSFLLYMISSLTNFRPGALHYNFGDAHIYLDHVKQCGEQIEREPFSLPVLKMRSRDSIDDFTFEDFAIEKYNYHPTIKAPVSV